MLKVNSYQQECNSNPSIQQLEIVWSLYINNENGTE